MNQGLQADVLIAGRAEGPVLALSRPISFWGGVNPKTGRISDPRHPEHGAAIAGTILVLAGIIGSSSSSAIMLELIANGLAPAALLLGETDAILLLGILVARELGHPAVPALRLAPAGLEAVRTVRRLAIASDGLIAPIGG